MAVNEELTRFLKEGLERGLPRRELEEVLLQTGWPSDQVEGALASYADVAFPLAVPVPRPYLSAREAFVYLVLFSTLYVSAFSLGSLVFELINQAFPDPTSAVPLAMSRESMRWSISLLIVTFPVFAYVQFRSDAALQADPTRRLSVVRRWLTYLTLFVASGMLVGDVTSVVFHLLSGEVTIRFFLKVITVGVIAGGVFWHLVRAVRDEEVTS
jgi:hypothetical protein